MTSQFFRVRRLGKNNSFVFKSIFAGVMEAVMAKLNLKTTLTIEYISLVYLKKNRNTFLSKSFLLTND